MPGPTSSRRRYFARMREAALKPPPPVHGMPVEVYSMIMGLLQPSDLLSLSRTSVRFRAVVLSPHSQLAWKSSIEIVAGLPPCPVGMSEPAYARLVYEDRCTGCSQRKVPRGDILWELYVRLCARCRVNQLFTGDLASHLPSNNVPEGLTVGVLLPSVQEKGKTTYLLAAVEELRKALLDATDQTVMERTAMLQGFQARAAAATQHASLCRAWVRTTNIAEHTVKMRRVADIAARLNVLGFDADVGYLGMSHIALLDHPAANRAVDLTNDEWEIIYPAIRRWMDHRRLLRLDWQERGILCARLRRLGSSLNRLRRGDPSNTVFPSVSDLAAMPEVEVVVTLPKTMVIPTDAFAKMLPDVLTRWRAHIHSELTKLVSNSSPPVAPHSLLRRSSRFDPPPPLELARAWIRCNACFQPQTWPEVLAHPCRVLMDPELWIHTLANTPTIDGRLPCIKGSIFANSVAVTYNGFTSWSSSLFHSCTSLADEVITACGKDPLVTTAAQLDQLDARLMCRACSSDGRSSVVMGWRAAVTHAIEDHRFPGEDESDICSHQPVNTRWTRVSANMRCKAKTVEAACKKGSLQAYDDRCRWVCPICFVGSKEKFTKEEVLLHLQHWHHIAEPDASTVRRRGDTMPFTPDPVVFLSPDVKGKLQTIEEQYWEERDQVSVALHTF